MNGIVYHIVSGHAFFTAVLLLIISAVASTQSRPLFRRITGLSFLLGAIAITISSTALPYWCYWGAVIATLAWMASRYIKPWRQWAAYIVIVAWLAVAAVEVPYHITPSLRPTSDRSITIIGDSVTAGVGGSEQSETWPSILAREHQLQVQDISHMGETASSALKHAQKHPITGSVVVVEIGGNDVLGDTTPLRFATELNALLTQLSAPSRQIVMFELPLPPFYDEYGRAQRTAAAKHHVALVPKRVFLSVIAGSDSTLDTIHLSQSGHELMADVVWRLVENAFEPRNVEQ